MAQQLRGLTAQPQDLRPISGMEEESSDPASVLRPTLSVSVSLSKDGKIVLFQYFPL